MKTLDVSATRNKISIKIIERNILKISNLKIINFKDLS